MSDTLKTLLELLDLENVGTDLFRGRVPKQSRRRVFGGHVIGQALGAAIRTVEEHSAHSLHAYFLRPGDPKVPIVYEVDRIRDGRSFTSRRVVARQHDSTIYHMSVSFQIAEMGVEHQIEMPNVPKPDELPDEMERRKSIAHLMPEEARKRFLSERPIEVRPIHPRLPFNPEPAPPVSRYWVRTRAILPPEFDQHECLLAYASDMTLGETALWPHGMTWYGSQTVSASLDHSMWFHRPFRGDEWLLFDQSSPSSFGGRGLNFGNIFSADGRFIAAMTQEGMVRQRG